MLSHYNEDQKIVVRDERFHPKHGDFIFSALCLIEILLSLRGTHYRFLAIQAMKLKTDIAGEEFVAIKTTVRTLQYRLEQALEKSDSNNQFDFT